MNTKAFPWDPGDQFPGDFTEALRKTLWNQEGALAYRPYETLFAYGENGELLFRKNGDAGSVTLNELEMAVARASVWTHNHPTGNTFSPNDVRVAFVCQVRELRAVDQHWVYRLRDPDNWTAEKWAMIEGGLWEKIIKAVAADESVATADLVHEVWRRIFAELGMSYWRVGWAPSPQ
jgi:hypothetical protein